MFHITFEHFTIFPKMCNFTIISPILNSLHFKLHPRTAHLKLTHYCIQLELTKHITPNANGEPILKRSSPHSLLPSSATILLVRSANGDAPFQGKFQVNLLNDDTFTDGIMRCHPTDK